MKYSLKNFLEMNIALDSMHSLLLVVTPQRQALKQKYKPHYNIY